MRRILFVDDEPRVLEALQRQLRPYRNQWRVVCAVGGEAALTELEKESFDVVVSDMRMPGMDGAELLRLVQERHPQVVRVVLSGHTELAAAFRAVPVAHQFLSKPSDAQTIRQVIERSCSLQQLLSSETLRAVVGQLGRLPSLPRTYTELTRLLARPDVPMPAVASVIEHDIAMSAKCLQLVNSAFFGLPRRVSTIEQAVMYLGLETLKNLVLTTETFQAFRSGCPPGIALERLEQHTLFTARLIKRLLPDRRQAEDAVFAAMLHEVGLLVLAVRLPERFEAAVSLAEQSGLRLAEAEVEVFGVDHAVVGAYLLGLWGLPHPIVEAVARHRAPWEQRPATFDVVSALYVAELLAEECGVCPGPGTDRPPSWSLDFLASLGVLPRLEDWRALARSFRDGVTR